MLTEKMMWVAAAVAALTFAGCSQWPESVAGRPAAGPSPAASAARSAAGDSSSDSVSLGGASGSESAGPQTKWQVTAAAPVDAFGRFQGMSNGGEAASRAFESARQNSFADLGADCDPDVDRKGQSIVFASTRHSMTSSLYIKRVNGVTVTQLTGDAANDAQPRFSPSGRQVAFASDRAGNWDIWLIDIDGHNRIRLTDSPSPEMAPTWSPDGRRIAYSAFGLRSGQWELWVLDLGNPASRTFLGYGLFPSWCPDGKADRIAFQRARQRGSNEFSVWTVDLVNGEPRYPTEVAPAAGGWAAICPSWSPDGKRIVFTETKVISPSPGGPAVGEGGQQPAGQSAVCAIDADGTNRIRLVEPRGVNARPVWASDGKVYFSSDRQGRESIFSLNVSGTSPAQEALKDAALTNQPTAAVPAE